MFFGLGPRQMSQEEECQCRGDSACLYPNALGRGRRERRRVPSTSRCVPEHLEARLTQLQEMITDLASNERYEDVLQGIVGSTMEAVFAGGVVLALEPRIGQPSEGLLRRTHRGGGGRDR